jgi:hypothetical protein
MSNPSWYALDPDVAGGLGPNTLLDTSTHPPVVKRLHYVFAGWDGDVLVKSFPVHLVTEPVRDALLAMGASGVEFAAAEVTTSDEFRQLYSGVKLPPFVWLKPTGTPGVDDIGFSSKFRLIVSQRVYDLFLEKGIPYALVEPFSA